MRTRQDSGHHDDDQEGKGLEMEASCKREKRVTFKYKVRRNEPMLKCDSGVQLKGKQGGSSQASSKKCGARRPRKNRLSEVLRLQKALAAAPWTDSKAVESQEDVIPYD